MPAAVHPDAAHPSPHPAGQLSPLTGTLLIVANMVGVGVFTTTGYMLGALHSAPAVLLAWGIGGLAALCGAVSYAELGSALPRNGGEFQLLSRIYHPAVGFMAGWVALVVGFSAPLAFYGHVFGDYLAQLFPGLPPLAAGIALIIVFAVTHSVHVGGGARLHNVVTVGKVLLIVAFIVAGLYRGDPGRLLLSQDASLGSTLFQSTFAVQLVYVSFSYSGWNAAAYLVGEFHEPQRDLPRAVLAGTLITTGLYLGLNAALLCAAPPEEIAGRKDVAVVAAGRLFGPLGGGLATGLIALGLVSTVSANLIAGPRVCEAIGREHPALRFLAVRRAGGGPVVAIALQAAIAIGLLVSASFSTLLEYIGVTLSLSASATVLGLFVLRHREPALPRPYRAWGHPVSPVLFLLLEGWMIAHTLSTRPLAAAWVAATLCSGGVFYVALRWSQSGGPGHNASG